MYLLPVLLPPPLPPFLLAPVLIGLIRPEQAWEIWQHLQSQTPWCPPPHLQEAVSRLALWLCPVNSPVQ